MAFFSTFFLIKVLPSVGNEKEPIRKEFALSAIIQIPPPDNGSRKPSMDTKACFICIYAEYIIKIKSRQIERRDTVSLNSVADSTVQYKKQTTYQNTGTHLQHHRPGVLVRMLGMGNFFGILGDRLKDDRINLDRRAGPCCRCGGCCCLLVRTDRFLLLVAVSSSSTWYGCEGYLLLHRGLLHFEITPHRTTVLFLILRHFRSYFPLDHLSLFQQRVLHSSLCCALCLFSRFGSPGKTTGGPKKLLLVAAATN